jgi:hypothetical protein
LTVVLPRNFNFDKVIPVERPARSATAAPAAIRLRRFASAPSGSASAQAHDSALTTASAEIKWLNGWSAAATFEGEFSDVTRSYAGKSVIRYTW